MAYTCPTCGGSGKVGAFTCPRCLGRKTLVEDSQGLTVAWGSINLGLLTGVDLESASVDMVDLTSMDAVIHPFKNAAGTISHYGAIKWEEPGDISPGRASLSWIGSNGLTDNLVGSENLLTVTHAVGGATITRLSKHAVLIKFDSSLSVGGLVEGSAEFQFIGG